MSHAARILFVPLSVSVAACSLLSLSGCGSSDDSQQPVAGASGNSPAAGSSNASAGKGSGGKGGGSNAAGGDGSDTAGEGGSNAVGGGGSPPAGGGGPVTPVCNGQPQWTDISTAQINSLGGSNAQSYPGGVSGVVVNHLTGDVTIHIVGFGLWRSSNQGGSWARIDDGVIDKNGGRCETGWGLQYDPDDPTRLASFTLDGTAGYTADGMAWKGWAESGWGRNWDFGAVDWSADGAQTIFGVLHETTPRSLYLISTNGGTSWSAIDNNHVANMVGVIDSKTLIASRTSGIERSTDLGETWKSVSDVTPLGHVAIRFQSKYYVTSADGILVSADQGMTWKKQGTAIANTKMYQGPYFGTDENTMVVGTQPNDNVFGAGSSIYKTSDGGATWTKVADVPTPNNGFPISYAWYGSFAWDPMSDTYYTSAMSNPAYRLDCTH
ncbi:MAG TPA: hypothetical protein VFK05_03100 [Polyangiaceae bacterium]|nr:hypothetical protein [Polyangiaceae bacterium]